MFTSLRMRLLSCLFFLASPLCGEEPLAAETPPTTEEVQAALEKLSKWFTLNPSSSPWTAASVKQPDWYPLKPEDTTRVEEVLKAWGANRAKGAKLRCQFRQWEYDPAFGPKDPAFPYIYSEGEYRWDAPDIWMWRGTSVKKAVVNGVRTQWRDVDPETWARNKATFYELDHRSKTLYERRFPEGLADSPCYAVFGFSVGPFASYADLFRLDPAGLQDRFWIRPVTAETGKNERWLELHPKKVDNARLFSSVLVAISESDWEICALDMRAPNYSAKTNPAHTSLEFRNRTRPTAGPGLTTKVFGGSLDCVPSIPPGWKKVVEDLRDLRDRK